MLTEDENDYIKNLTYSYIGHFSKFIKPDSRRIGFSRYTDKLEVTCFKNPNDDIVVVILNKTDFNINFNIAISGRFYNDSIDSHSILTYRIKQ